MLLKLFRQMFDKIICADTKPLEITVAVQSMLWGILLLFPADTFGTSRIYSVMAQITSEEIWGVITLAIGFLQLIFVHIQKCDIRRYIAIVSLFLWVFIDVAFWLSGSPSTGAVTYLVTVLILMWSVLSLYSPKGKCP